MVSDFQQPPRRLALVSHVGGLISAIALVLGLQTLDQSVNSTQPAPAVAAITSINIARLDAESIHAPGSPIDLTAQAPRFTAAELAMARQAWQYFEHNWNAKTGLVSTSDQSSTASMSDVAATLAAIVSARELNIIGEAEFGNKMNTILKTLATLKLYRDELPNRFYNVKTGAPAAPKQSMQSQEVGWSALEIGRLARWLKLVGTRYPQLRSQTEAVWQSWHVAALTKDGWLYSTKLSQGQEQYASQGRLGYEEYAAYGLKLWGLPVERALAPKSVNWVKLYGQSVPVDQRPSQNKSDAAVLSEPYILDGLETGFRALPKAYADGILAAQVGRYQATHQLTAVTEDHLDRSPGFLYNALYADQTAWAAIAYQHPFNDFRFLSSKAAIGWHALYHTRYTQKLVEFVNTHLVSDRGWYSGYYETLQQPNRALTADTNSLILESVLYQKIDQPLMEWAGVLRLQSIDSGEYSKKS